MENLSKETMPAITKKHAFASRVKSILTADFGRTGKLSFRLNKNIDNCSVIKLKQIESF